MKILNKLYKFSIGNSEAIGLASTKRIGDFDNSDFRDEQFKKNILFATIFIFLIVLFALLYIFFKNTSIEKANEENNILPPLKIVVPYPNNSINIDDYEILKYNIKQGDNLSNILTKEIKISNSDAYSVLMALKNIYNVSQLKVGQTIEIKYRVIINQNEKGEIEEKVLLEELKIELTEKEEEIIVDLNKDNIYQARKNKISLNKNYLKYKVKITDSLYNDGISAGIPAGIMVDFIKFFSFDIDFQRDLRGGDEFEILFEIYSTDDGKKIKDGNIIFAHLENQGRIYDIYRYNINGGTYYFNSNGQSAQKSLLKTPINGARISSNFGFRKHPILGYNKLHSGKDFAAPTGTPIFAAGSGTVVKAQFWSSFGNYVRIKHVGGYETEYAHASKIASGIRPGVKVKQGQVIAYVGTTGRSTGPHLHFGVIYNNKRINPDRVKSLPTIKLVGKDLINFKKEVEKINLYRTNIPNQNLRLK